MGQLEDTQNDAGEAGPGPPAPENSTRPHRLLPATTTATQAVTKPSTTTTALPSADQAMAARLVHHQHPRCTHPIPLETAAAGTTTPSAGGPRSGQIQPESGDLAPLQPS
jgi:hypothetical protein